jgi:hypothetical protein
MPSVGGCRQHGPTRLWPHAGQFPSAARIHASARSTPARSRVRCRRTSARYIDCRHRRPVRRRVHGPHRWSRTACTGFEGRWCRRSPDGSVRRRTRSALQAGHRGLPGGTSTALRGGDVRPSGERWSSHGPQRRRAACSRSPRSLRVPRDACGRAVGRSPGPRAFRGSSKRLRGLRTVGLEPHGHPSSMPTEWRLSRSDRDRGPPDGGSRSARLTGWTGPGWTTHGSPTPRGGERPVLFPLRRMEYSP